MQEQYTKNAIEKSELYPHVNDIIASFLEKHNYPRYIYKHDVFDYVMSHACILQSPNRVQWKKTVVGFVMRQHGYVPPSKSSKEYQRVHTDD